MDYKNTYEEYSDSSTCLDPACLKGNRFTLDPKDVSFVSFSWRHSSREKTTTLWQLYDNFVFHRFVEVKVMLKSYSLTSSICVKVYTEMNFFYKHWTSTPWCRQSWIFFPSKKNLTIKCRRFWSGFVYLCWISPGNSLENR